MSAEQSPLAMRILFVENHPVFAHLATQQYLHGHQVTQALTLDEARAHLKQTHFDAVLVDFDLDDGKGDELVRELRDVARIIAISAHEAGNAALLAAGAHACCPKARFQDIAAFLEPAP